MPNQPPLEPLSAPSLKLNQQPAPSKIKLIYDIAMLVAISIDLLLIVIDIILMSTLFGHMMTWVGLSQWVEVYRANIHEPLKTAGEVFTVFLIAELVLRWGLAIATQRHYRWFFFPFIHWYEVLGCLPQFRALRLLRAVVIGRRLYQLGYQVLPASWLSTGKFYMDVVLEELSDRVILTAIGNIRQQLADSAASTALLKTTLEHNQVAIERAIVELLTKSLSPYLQPVNSHDDTAIVTKALASEVGAAIQEGLAKTPELNRYLRLIPIAGSLIESQLLDIGQHVGENVVTALNKRLLDPQSLDKVLSQIAQGIVQIDVSSPSLEALLKTLIDDALIGLEAQVKVQQWKHHKHLKLP
ncbi:MAG: hypothetical protein Q4P13_11910 [Psychrobacter sp.]|nr:hypothetical protein [Psychrobacter sp.]